MTSNWIFNSKPTLTLNDKVKELLKISHKLVLVQQHELERIKQAGYASKHTEYIEYLYNHYIVEGKPKTYLT